MKVLMAGVVGFLVCAAAVVGPLMAQQGGSPAAASDRRASAQSGSGLFGSMCASCHGEAGTGGYGVALRGARFTVPYVTAAIESGRPGTIMPAFAGALTSAEITAIARFVADAASRPVAAPTPRRTRTDSAAPPQVSAGFYTAEQARRGHALFLGNCAHCHTAERQPSESAAKTPRGVALGGERRLWSLVSDGTPRRWGRVSYVFQKTAKSMPAHAPRPLPPQDSADIVAYLLQANGLPPGTERLTPDIAMMKNMTLDELGFERLFNGRDFTGIKFVIGCFGWPRDPAGCKEGDTPPGDTFKVEDGTIHTIGLPQGYWYPDRKFLNFTLRFEYRFEPVEYVDSEREFHGNSGILLFVQQHQVWPKSLEIQGQPSNVLMGFGVGARVKGTVDAEARTRAAKPFGQWNAVEVVSRNGQVTSSLNGVPVSTVSEHEFTEAGFIAFQSEGSDSRWRNIRIRPE